MSNAYTLRTQILSVQAAIASARQCCHSSTNTVSSLGYRALITPAMAQAQGLDPSLGISFSLYKRHWECYPGQCRKCVDTMRKAITWKENEAESMDRLERGALDETEREGQEKLIGKAMEMFDEEVGVLEWEMDTLTSCFVRLGVEWRSIEEMAGWKVLELC